jgi:hypothetical protein
VRRGLLAVVVAACAVAGGIVGAAGTGLVTGGTETPSALPVVARLPASVLDRPQRPADLAGVPATPGLRRSTLRRAAPLAGGGALLVGRDATGGRCVVAVASAHGLFRAGCVPEAAFPSGGTRVAWSERTGRARAAEWDADGTVRAGPSGEGQ